MKNKTLHALALLALAMLLLWKPELIPILGQEVTLDLIIRTICSNFYIKLLVLEIRGVMHRPPNKKPAEIRNKDEPDRAYEKGAVNPQTIQPPTKKECTDD